MEGGGDERREDETVDVDVVSIIILVGIVVGEARGEEMLDVDRGEGRGVIAERDVGVVGVINIFISFSCSARNID